MRGLLMLLLAVSGSSRYGELSFVDAMGPWVAEYGAVNAGGGISHGMLRAAWNSGETLNFTTSPRGAKHARAARHAMAACMIRATENRYTATLRNPAKMRQHQS